MNETKDLANSLSRLPSFSSSVTGSGHTGITGLWTLDTGLWTLDAKCWILDAGLSTLDVGCYTLDTRLWALDTIFDSFRTKSEASF